MIDQLRIKALEGDLQNCREVRSLLRSHIRMLRILLAWSKGTITPSEAEARLGLQRGELWALERREVETVVKGDG